MRRTRRCRPAWRSSRVQRMMLVKTCDLLHGPHVTVGRRQTSVQSQTTSLQLPKSVQGVRGGETLLSRPLCTYLALSISQHYCSLSGLFFLFPSDINIGKNKKSVSQHSILVQLLWCKPPPPPPPPPPTRPNGEWGYSTRRHMLGPERPEAVLPDRAFYLPTLSHLLIVNVNLHSHECPAAVSP